MTLEATTPEETNNTGKPKGKRAARATATKSNPAVNQQLEDIGVSAEVSREDAILQEAQNAVANEPLDNGFSAQREEQPINTEMLSKFQANLHEEQEPPPPQQEWQDNPFERQEAPAPQPSPKARREDTFHERTKQQPPPSTKKFGALGKKLPGAEKAKVHRRMDNGTLGYVGEFTNNDLSQSQDIESFLNRYIKPKHGPGEYQITGVDAYGREYDMGVVTLIEPKTEIPDLVPLSAKSPLDLLQQTLEDNNRRRDLEIKMLMQNQKDPIESLHRLQELNRTLQPSEQPRDQSVLASAISGGFAMLTAVLPVLLAPREDPLMKFLLAKMMEDGSSRRGDPMPALPPPAPPVDPTEQLKNLAAVVASLRGNDSNSDSKWMELLMRDRMSPADVLNLVNQVKGERGTDDFKKTMENMGFLINATQQIRTVADPGGGPGFLDGLVGLLTNKEAVSAIASRFGRGAPEPAQLPSNTQQQPQMDPALRQKAQELTLRRMRVEELKLQEEEKRLGIGIQAPALVTPAPKAIEQGAPAPVAAPAETPAAEVEAAPAPDPKDKLPKNIADFINRYVLAQTKEEVLETTLDMLEDLGSEEEWKPYAGVLLEKLASGNKPEFMHYMASFFVGIHTVGLMEDVLAKQVMTILDASFEELVQLATNEDPDDALHLAEAGDTLGVEGDDGEGDDEEGDEEEEGE